MKSTTTRRQFLGTLKHLWSSTRSCTRTAEKDRVHGHFHMTLGSVHIPRTKPAASDATPAENTQNTGERVLNISPHGALGCLALTSATLVASTPTSSSGNSRLGDGGRGASKTVCVKKRVPFVIGVGRRLRNTGGLRSRSCGSGGFQRQRRMAEILSRQPGVHEQHVRGAAGEVGLAGNSWWPSP